MKMVEDIRVIKTILRATPIVVEYINQLVLATSEIETRASAIYTLAILTANEEEKGDIPPKMFDQSFMTACMRSAAYAGDVNYICDRSKSYIVRAQCSVPPLIQEEFNFAKFSQLLNQLGRRFHTCMINNMFMHANIVPSQQE
jgi:hypothetical protein